MAIVYIYCNYKEQNEQRVSHLIASILKQLVQLAPAISEDVKFLFEKHSAKNERPALIDLQDTLRTEVERWSKSQVFLIIDALDECRDDDGSRTELLKTLGSLPTHAKWLITSRNMRSIELDMQGSKRLDICADDEDVRRYVKQRILQERRLNSNVKQKPGLEDTIVSTVMSKVKGMCVISFHPIYCHI